MVNFWLTNHMFRLFLFFILTGLHVFAASHDSDSVWRDVECEGRPTWLFKAENHAGKSIYIYGVTPGVSEECIPTCVGAELFTCDALYTESTKKRDVVNLQKIRSDYELIHATNFKPFYNALSNKTKSVLIARQQKNKKKSVNFRELHPIVMIASAQNKLYLSESWMLDWLENECVKLKKPLKSLLPKEKMEALQMYYEFNEKYDRSFNDTFKQDFVRSVDIMNDPMEEDVEISKARARAYNDADQHYSFGSRTPSFVSHLNASWVDAVMNTVIPNYRKACLAVDVQHLSLNGSGKNFLDLLAQQGFFISQFYTNGSWELVHEARKFSLVNGKVCNSPDSVACVQREPESTGASVFSFICGFPF